MNKAQLDVLEKIYEKEIIGGVYQPNKCSRVLGHLINDGYVEFREWVEPPTTSFPFPMTVKGYVLTYSGNQAYCTSDRCKI